MTNTKHSKVIEYSAKLIDLSLLKYSSNDINRPNVSITDVLDNEFTIHSMGRASISDWINLLEDSLLIAKEMQETKTDE
jgi:hypothetical protein